MPQTLYRVDSFPLFGGNLSTEIDYKGRASVPAGILNVIRQRNYAYLLSIDAGSPPFKLRNTGIYLGGSAVAALESIEERTASGKSDLVELVRHAVTVDAGNINRQIHARTARVGEKTFLIGYAFFDWLLYMREKTRGFTDEQQLDWAIANNYSQVDIDKQGRIQTHHLSYMLGLSERIGFMGYKDVIYIGNDLALGAGRAIAMDLKGPRKRNKQHHPAPDKHGHIQDKFFGVDEELGLRPMILMEIPETRTQLELYPHPHNYSADLAKSWIIHPRGTFHERGNRQHRRSKTPHNNPQAQSGQHSLNF
ncbi:hypothetical protein HYY71_00535 [Candidatus Woesearchaeota archaeon]|nr:hypothetical protein [Candidatus Woesearchaeota archaeon]